ncbi:MAG: CHAT domain-containing protein [Bacteroidota bacterium]
MSKPLIYLTFANDPDAHLDLLKEESKRLFNALEEPKRKEYIEVEREESAELDEIFDYFTRNKDKVAIFHYGGHADGSRLHLEGGGGNAKGLGTLLGEQKNLKLVFLNGCSSKGQVEELFAQGVKAVIATSVPIQDSKAVEFAEQFYEALAYRRNIGHAFKLAAAFMKSRYNEGPEIQYRAYIFKRGEPIKAELPWGLYIQKEYEDEIKNWKLPHYQKISFSKDLIQYIGQSFSSNRYIMLVLEELCRYNPDIYAQMFEERGGEKVKKDSKYYPEIIIRNFPWPIGSQIRLLRVADEANIERLETLISTYLITGKALYYILLSDLWNHVRKSKISLPTEFKSGFPMNKEAYQQFDFWAGMKRIFHLFKTKEISPFVEEFEEMIIGWREEDNQAQAHLENLRKELQFGETPADMVASSTLAERALALLLKKAAFLARYRMLTVRNINMEKTRLRTLTYELDMGALNALEDRGLGMYMDEANRRKLAVSHSHSVILTVNEDRLDDSLNLSPFIIDKFTFAQAVNKTKQLSNKEARIYLMGWEDEEKLYYLTVDHQLYQSMRNEHQEDLIHTDIQASAYQEGKGEKKGMEDAFGAFGDDPFAEAESEDNSPKVFESLKDEFETFKLDTSLL